PNLALSWDVEDEGRRYRFQLRPDAVFHDGTPVRASDVRAHLERLLEPRTQSPAAWMFREVIGAEAFVAGQAGHVSGLEPTGDHTLEIVLTEARSFFPHLLTLPPTGISRIDAGGRCVGTGPFRISRFEEKGATLERSPSYFRPEHPHLDRL